MCDAGAVSTSIRLLGGKSTPSLEGDRFNVRLGTAAESFDLDADPLDNT